MIKEIEKNPICKSSLKEKHLNNDEETDSTAQYETKRRSTFSRMNQIKEKSFREKTVNEEKIIKNELFIQCCDKKKGAK